MKSKYKNSFLIKWQFVLRYVYRFLSFPNWEYSLFPIKILHAKTPSNFSNETIQPRNINLFGTNIKK